MRKKLLTIICIILAFFVGLLSMYMIMYFFPSDLGKTVIKDTKNVNITSNDSISESVDKLYNAVVVVQNFNNGKQLGSGTGFVYKTDEKNGYIITNNHVVEGGDTFNIIFSNGKSVKLFF